MPDGRTRTPMSHRAHRPNYHSPRGSMPLEPLRAVGVSGGPMTGWSSASRARAGVSDAQNKRNETHIRMGWGRSGNVDVGLQTSALAGRDQGERYEVARTNVQQGWGSLSARGSMGGTTTSAYGSVAVPTPLSTPPTTPHYNALSGQRDLTPRPGTVTGFDTYVHAGRQQARLALPRASGNVGGNCVRGRWDPSLAAPQAVRLHLLAPNAQSLVRRTHRSACICRPTRAVRPGASHRRQSTRGRRGCRRRRDGRTQRWR